MHIKPFSHLDNHSFIEYQGYEEGLDKTSYTQYEVVDDKKYIEIALEVEHGDLIMFDRNLLHRSEVNLSNEVKYLFINRCFDIEKDLTLSSANLNLRPYSKESLQIGRKLFF